MKRLLQIMLLFAVISKLNAQQDAMFSYYMFNTNAINPAYAGSRNVLSINGLHRSQWVGLDGAPTTQTLNIHSPLWGKNTGVGLAYYQDKIGVTKTSSIYADFSYRIKLSATYNLALGFKGGFDRIVDDLTELNNAQTDQTFQENYESKFLPNFGTGLYLTSDRFYAGLSVPRLLKHNLTDPNNTETSRLRGSQRHYFFIAGTVLKINENFIFKPTTQIKAVKGAPMEIDFTATFFIRKRVWAGAMFRSNDALGCLVGINITDQLALGYAYDWSYANLTHYQSSNEIVFRYDFTFKHEKRIYSPRYF
jgi:type IX secretion system PorP/SprF family membrane protein